MGLLKNRLGIPDLGAMQAQLDEKFQRLIDKLDEILRELRTQRGSPVDRERGGVPLAMLILAVGIIVVFAVAMDACLDDPDERDDLGYRVELTSRYDDGDDYGGGGNDRDDSGDGSGDCAGAHDQCQDNDFSPGEIIICIEPGSCRFDGEEEEA